MSVFGVEQVLWDVSRDKARADAFRAEPAAFLGLYKIDPDEAAAVQAMDVHLLSTRGVNPMLLMQAWNTLVGPDCIGEYLSRMSAAAAGKEYSNG